MKAKTLIEAGIPAPTVHPFDRWKAAVTAKYPGAKFQPNSYEDEPGGYWSAELDGQDVGSFEIKRNGDEGKMGRVGPGEGPDEAPVINFAKVPKLERPAAPPKTQVTHVGTGRVNRKWSKAWDRGENV